MSWRERCPAWVGPVLEAALPPVSAIRARRHLPDRTDTDFTQAEATAREWLASATKAPEYVAWLDEYTLGGGTSLEAKASGIIGALAVLLAATVAIGIVVWDASDLWERVLFFLSGTYSTAALVAALMALRPRRMYVLTAATLRTLARPGITDEEYAVRVAAYRLACVEMNTNPMMRLANLVSVAGQCARNAIIVAIPALVALAVAHFTSTSSATLTPPSLSPSPTPIVCSHAQLQRHCPSGVATP
jgi:hypothetical protein